IRDLIVTGVQTCALPIYRLRATRRVPGVAPNRAGARDRAWSVPRCGEPRGGCVRVDTRGSVTLGFDRTRPTRCVLAFSATCTPRSEERRVGKGGHARRRA